MMACGVMPLCMYEYRRMMLEISLFYNELNSVSVRYYSPSSDVPRILYFR